MGIASSLLACIPLLIVAGLLAAYLSGSPPLPRFAAIPIFVGYGSSAVLAIAIGLAAFFDRFSLLATVGIVCGIMEISVLAALYSLFTFFR